MPKMAIVVRIICRSNNSALEGLLACTNASHTEGLRTRSCNGHPYNGSKHHDNRREVEFSEEGTHVLGFVCITTLEGCGCAVDEEKVQQVFISMDSVFGLSCWHNVASSRHQ